ncbi:hypothetical protein DL93DRAFT_2099591 [Clavulina sp. PMI_390]|nr:hypothetical protein DL93DRAFT_2099591 [Clavulina sp. PMI_390]
MSLVTIETRSYIQFVTSAHRSTDLFPSSLHQLVFPSTAWRQLSKKMASLDSADDRLQSAKIDSEPNPLFISPYHAASISVPLAFAVSKTLLAVLGWSLGINLFDILLSYLGIILYVLSIIEPSLQNPAWRPFFRFNLWIPFSSFLYRYSIPRRVATVYHVLDTMMLVVGLLIGFTFMGLRAWLWLVRGERDTNLIRTVDDWGLVASTIVGIRSAISLVLMLF